MLAESESDSRLESKRREQTPQALARLAVVGLFISLWFVLWVARIPMPLPFLAVLLLEVLFFLVYWRTVFFLPSVRAVELAQYGMLAAEIVFHTTMVYFLGGVSWLGAFAYVFGLIFANTFLDRRRGLVYTSGASLAFVSLIVLEATGTIPHYVFLEQGPLRYTDARFVTTTVIAGAGVFFSIYVWVNWVGHQLRQERDAAVGAQDGLLQARTQLQQANAELEERVAMRTTELQQANSALSESEGRYRDYYERAPNAYMAIDTETGEIIECNQTTADMLGYRKDDIIGRKVFEFYTPAAAEKAGRLLEAFRATGVVRGVELQIRHKDGTIVDVILDATAVRDENGRVVRSRSVWRDVTERKRAEAALGKLRSQNDLILNSAGEGIYGLDLHGRTTFVNPAAARMIGWEVDELIDKPQHDVLHHSRLDGTPYPREECPIYAAFNDGSVHRVADEVFWRKDGTSFPVEYISAPIRDERGDLAGAVVTFTDITERKLAEEALQESEQRYRTLSEHHPDGVALTIDRKVEYANPALTEMLGYSADEIRGRSPLEFVAPDQRDRLAERLRSLSHGQSLPAAQFDLLLKSGGLLPVEFLSRPIRYDGKQAIFTVLRDMTERKRAEEALRESEAKYRQMFENVQDLFYQTDMSGAIIEMSPSVERYGYTREGLIGTSVLDIYADPDERAAFVQEMLKQGHVTDYEIRLKSGDGRLIDSSISARVFNGPDGEQIGFEGVIRDISERKKAEEALRESEETLKATLESTADGILVRDSDWHISYINARFIEMWGLPAELVETRDVSKLLPLVLDQLDDAEEAEWQISRLTHSSEESLETLILKDGRVFEQFSVPLRLGSGAEGRVVSVRDVTERKRAEQVLQEAASRDPLTGLLNRRAGLAAMEERLEAARRSGSRFALLGVDVDHFKSVNDTFGHEAGDEALILLRGDGRCDWRSGSRLPNGRR